MQQRDHKCQGEEESVRGLLHMGESAEALSQAIQSFMGFLQIRGHTCERRDP